MTTDNNSTLPPWLPLVVGAILVAQFAGLGVWQISRGLEKQATRDALTDIGSYASFHDGAELSVYQRLKVTGRFIPERQILIDNIVKSSRYGYYVLTPMEIAPDEPLVIVNRGWIQKSGPQPDMNELRERIEFAAETRTVLGRVGALPRPGMRMGNPITDYTRWPIVSVFPETEDLELSLGREVQPFVLLMDPDEPNGFLREWVPTEMGPGKHFGYAFQWFAMGAALSALLIWHYRKRRFHDDGL